MSTVNLQDWLRTRDVGMAAALRVYRVIGDDSCRFVTSQTDERAGYLVRISDAGLPVCGCLHPRHSTVCAHEALAAADRQTDELEELGLEALHTVWPDLVTKSDAALHTEERAWIHKSVWNEPLTPVESARCAAFYAELTRRDSARYADELRERGERYEARMVRVEALRDQWAKEASNVY